MVPAFTELTNINKANSAGLGKYKDGHVGKKEKNNSALATGAPLLALEKQLLRSKQVTQLELRVVSRNWV